MFITIVLQYLQTRSASSREFREGGGLKAPAGRDLWLGELPLRAGERLCHREDGGQHREEQVTGPHVIQGELEEGRNCLLR